MHHDLHQHLLVRQEAVQVQALALYTLTSNIKNMLKKYTKTTSHALTTSAIPYSGTWHSNDVMEGEKSLGLGQAIRDTNINNEKQERRRVVCKSVVFNLNLPHL